MNIFANKTVFITGASRGIGRAMALKLAGQGANIVIAAKSAEPQPNLEGTIYTVANEIEDLGAKALPIKVDVRYEEQIAEAIKLAVKTFGGIDILINNASAISLTPTEATPMKRFDLMFAVNVRATFACSQAAIPHLAKAENPHILNLAPPLNMQAKWFKDYLAYSMSKYGMSMCTLGLAEELKEQGIAVNSLWPKTAIATAAIRVHFPREIYEATRSPQIMADAAAVILQKSASSCSGNFFIDEGVLRANGVTNFDHYATNPKRELFPDLFLDT